MEPVFSDPEKTHKHNNEMQRPSREDDVTGSGLYSNWISITKPRIMQTKRNKIKKKKKKKTWQRASPKKIMKAMYGGSLEKGEMSGSLEVQRARTMMLVSLTRESCDLDLNVLTAATVKEGHGGRSRREKAMWDCPR